MFFNSWKKGQEENYSEKYETLLEEIRKNVILLKSYIGAMISAETSEYTTEILGRQCTEAWKNLVRKPNHPQDDFVKNKR